MRTVTYITARQTQISEVADFSHYLNPDGAHVEEDRKRPFCLPSKPSPTPRSKEPNHRDPIHLAGGERLEEETTRPSISTPGIDYPCRPWSNNKL